MRRILSYVLDYHRQTFEWRAYLATILFLSVCLAFNYTLDFEDSYVDDHENPVVAWFWMFLFQLLPFLGVCLILTFFSNADSKTFLSSSEFWLKAVIGFTFLAINRTYLGVPSLVSLLDSSTTYFVEKCVKSSSSIISIVLPMLLIYYLIDRKRNNVEWYGLSLKRFDVKPYLVMLCIMLLILGAGSFIADLQRHYPRFLHAGIGQFTSAYSWPRWLSVSVYELCYGVNFISVEVFFRGFLIFGFSRLLGPQVVLPMVATYCFLHFGKPMAEAISSIFGGYILGIIALRSDNIWGGVMIHLGVAWLMELLGWLQHIG